MGSRKAPLPRRSGGATSASSRFAILTTGPCLILTMLLGACSSCQVGDFRPADDVYLTAGKAPPTTASAPSSVPASAPASRPGAKGPVSVSVQDALLLTLENNKDLVLERYKPSIQRTFVDSALAVFDPLLTGLLQQQRTRSTSSSGAKTTADMTTGNAALEQFFPTGTTGSVTASVSATNSSASAEEYVASRLGMSVTQSLLRGFGEEVNLASVRQARLDVLNSQYELRGFAEALVAQVEQTCWDYALSLRQIEIYNQSLALAQQQLSETQERIKVGKLAETELAAAEAEVAVRREALIDARSALAKTRLKLLKLLNVPGENMWDRQIIFRDQPVVPDVNLEDVESHVKVAMRMRADLNQALLAVQRGELEIVKTRDGLLPKLDFFVTLGKTGYADSLGQSIVNLRRSSYDALAGVSLEDSILNRDARAKHQRAVLTRDQLREAVENFKLTIQVDVRSAYVEAQRAREQVTATAATRKLQEEKLRAETEKFRVGKSTSLLVAQAQRDLVASQIDEVLAVTTFLKALVDLYRLEGSLLVRRGVHAPGAEPVKE
jgi:outer membrane protein